MLHGFPEFSYGWRHQIPALVDAGYRVWAPDQRGYNLSDKPEGIAAYNLDALAADVVGLIDAAGSEKAFLIGHDWGGLVAWQVAARYPDRLAKLVVLNAPNTAAGQGRRISLAQLRKSWYILFFQLPWLPEYLMRQKRWQLVVNSLTGSSRPATFSDRELERYRQAWSQPNAFRAMLNWYRALLRNPPSPPASRRIGVPTLLIWGAKDRFLGKELAQPSIARCTEGRLVFIENATHWVQHEEPQRVNALILDHFLKASAS